MRHAILVPLLTMAMAAPAARLTAQASDPAKPPSSPDTSVVRTISGFVDLYYAWDLNRPRNFDRAYTTQAARHAEFNVNLAVLEAKVAAPHYRGRLALQWGTSVQSNYAAEPRNGAVSGPSVSQYIQEASIGYKVSPSLWIDGGVFLSHLGLEGWMSNSNLAYTRSFVAEFSPYYEAGVKATWSTSDALTTTFVLVNGWQNISAYSSTPSVGVRFDYQLSPHTTVSYDNFVGNMAPDSAPQRLRFYHDLIVQWSPTCPWTVAVQGSYGTQKAATAGTYSWWGATALAKYRASDRLSIVGRLEHYADPKQVIVTTGASSGLRASGASLGADVQLAPALLWRNEARYFASPDAVWPLRAAGTFGKSGGALTTSFSLTF